jgi:DNA polymerase III alpha subunit
LASGFAGYAFCKAHSTAYGVEAYQSAWLKRYYPVEFMAAVLSNGKGFYHPLVYVLECHRLGISLRPPFVNQPGPMFTVEGQSIRVPLTRVKGLTERTRERLVAERHRGEFASMSDFYHRVVPAPDEMEAMIRVGAFDPFGKTRTAQFWEAQHLAQGGEGRGQRSEGRGQKTGGRGQRAEDRSQRAEVRDQRTEDSEPELKRESLPLAHRMGEGPGVRVIPQSAFRNPHSEGANPHSELRNPQSSLVQGWLLPPPSLDRLPDVPLQEPTRRQCLEWEVELLDFAVSGHPLELHSHVAWDTYCPVSKLGEHLGEQVVACGLIIEQRTHHQVTGEPMKFLTLADWTGIVETELFAPTYRSYGLATVRYPVLEVTATVEPFENGRGFSLRVHRAGKPRTLNKTPSSSP